MEFTIVMPGRAPARMPITRPSTIIPRLSGAQAATRPAPRLTRISVTGPSENAQRPVDGDRERLERALALGQRQVDEPHEGIEEDRRANDGVGGNGDGRARA